MFQDIEPRVLRNQFSPRPSEEEDRVFIYQNRKALLSLTESGVDFPRVNEARKLWGIEERDLRYLFSVDETAFYLYAGEAAEKEAYHYRPITAVSGKSPKWLAFAGATAAHMADWYETHRFCGRCAAPLREKGDERAMVCPNCGEVYYPGISPVVIVGITNGDRLLLTKYSDKHSNYHRYALVAGFAEIGETLEDTVRREVMEEVGLKVRNIRYYKSQPWGFSDSLLSGFYADVDGSDEIRIDPDELSEGVWFTRDTLPKEDTPSSLTWSMIEAFRAGA